jgi:NAD(P)-dependent dehydrogenase (short-subunit alcohol dehydrogenase family)
VSAPGGFDKSLPAIPPGLTAVVTGAGSGVGAAVAMALGARGIQLALVGRRQDKLLQVQRAIQQAGGRAETYPCDVSQVDQVAQLGDWVTSHFGGAQILFNSAGIHTELVPIGESTPELWIQTLNVNLIGTYLTCRSLMGTMLQRGWGRIINVTSAAALSPPSGIASAYQLSKVAVNHFTRQLAAEVAGSGVTANVLHPGEVKTEMWAAIKADAGRRSGPGREALHWTGWVEETGGDPPEKSAEVVLWLLSPAGDAVNGQFLWVRDGLQKPRPAW